MNLIVVKGVIARHGAIESGLEERGPVVQAAACVVLADSGNPGVDGLAAVDGLDGRLPKDKVHEVVGFKDSNKVGLGQPQGVVLDRPDGVGEGGVGHAVDGVVVAGKVGGRGHVVVALRGEVGRDVGIG